MGAPPPNLLGSGGDRVGMPEIQKVSCLLHTPVFFFLTFVRLRRKSRHREIAGWGVRGISFQGEYPPTLPGWSGSSQGRRDHLPPLHRVYNIATDFNNRIGWQRGLKSKNDQRLTQHTDSLRDRWVLPQVVELYGVAHNPVASPPDQKTKVFRSSRLFGNRHRTTKES